MSTAARAAHPLIDDPPHIFVDDVAARICDSLAASPLDYQLANPGEPVLAAARLSACVRSRYSADAFGESGLHQYVLLGAGLDHHRVSSDTRCWAVDLPNVLAWRANVFVEAGIHDACAPVPCDLGDEVLLQLLADAGLDTSQPVFVAWLGATMYLEPTAVVSVLTQLGSLPVGSVLVADVILPISGRDEAGREYAHALAEALGGRELWRCTPSAEQIADWLGNAGWRAITQVGEADAVPAGFWDRSDSLRPMRLVNLVQAHR